MAQEFPDSDELRLYDDSSQYAQRRYRSKLRLDLILKVYGYLGILLFFVALGYFIFLRLDLNLTQDESKALLFASVGLVLSIFAFIARLAYRDSSILYSEDYIQFNPTGDLIKQWSIFENLGKKFIGKDDRNFNRFSPREIIQYLKSAEYLSSDDAESLHNALEIRNQVVHSLEFVSISSIREAVASVERINEALNSKLDSRVA